MENTVVKPFSVSGNIFEIVYWSIGFWLAVLFIIQLVMMWNGPVLIKEDNHFIIVVEVTSLLWYVVYSSMLLINPYKK